MAFVEVLLPESATPIQPRMGAYNDEPGSDLGEPVRKRSGHARKIEHERKAKDKDSNQASTPHLMPRFLDHFPEQDGI